MMKGIFGLSFFSALLSTGVSLECETCSSLSKSCHGHRKSCSADQDTCFTLLTETAGVAGTKNYVIAKGCEFSQSCKHEPFFLNFGQGRFQRDALSCCVGNECTYVSPKLQPINTTTNGKQCPACFSATGRCPSEVVQCTGSDDYCFLMVTPEVLGPAVTTKGCTKKSVCERFKSTEGLGFSKVVCQEASKATLMSGSVLLALSGLLWMKILY